MTDSIDLNNYNFFDMDSHHRVCIGTQLSPSISISTCTDTNMEHDGYGKIVLRERYEETGEAAAKPDGAGQSGMSITLDPESFAVETYKTSTGTKTYMIDGNTSQYKQVDGTDMFEFYTQPIRTSPEDELDTHTIKISIKKLLEGPTAYINS